MNITHVQNMNKNKNGKSYNILVLQKIKMYKIKMILLYSSMNRNKYIGIKLLILTLGIHLYFTYQ